MESRLQSKRPSIRSVARSVRGKLPFVTPAQLFVREMVIRARPVGPGPKIVVKDDTNSTVVDDYWNSHTVHESHGRFISAKESAAYLKWRNSKYMMFPEYMDLYGDHSGDTVLDYGCGPGDDTTGFLLYSKAAKVIAMDVSLRALGYLSRRLALHHVDFGRVELIRINDAVGKIPLGDSSVDWLHCGGVLHHTTHPQEIIREFRRVMKPGAQGRLMLYNRDSVCYHVWVAYAQLIVNKAFRGLTVDQAFTKSTDGPECPVSDAYSPHRVLEMITAAGLEGTFLGGYTSATEVDWFRTYGEAAKSDERLADEHRQFANELAMSEVGIPMYRGNFAGMGGVYTISKSA